METLFGGSSSRPEFDPRGQANEDLWNRLASSIIGGTAISPEYINKIVIPSTMNTMTAAGYGRSGATGEAVANATIAPQVELLKVLAGTYPHVASGTRSRSTGGIFGNQGILGGLGSLASGVGGAYTAYNMGGQRGQPQYDYETANDWWKALS